MTNSKINKDEGNIYSWGLGSFGQLGTDELYHKQATPKKISLKMIENLKNDSDKFNLALHPINIKKLMGSIKMVLSFDASFIFISKNDFIWNKMLLYLLDILEHHNLTDLSDHETFEMKNSRVSDTSSKYEGPDSFVNRFDPSNTTFYSNKTDKNESFS